MSFVGEVFSDVGDTMLGWWNTGGGKEMWESFCSIVGDLGALFLKVFNQNILPVWNTFVGMLRNAWRQHIQPILSKAMNTVSIVVYSRVQIPCPPRRKNPHKC